MTNQGGSGPGLAPPPPQDQQPPQHTLQQPAPAAQQSAPQPPQSSFGGYQPGAAVNGMFLLYLLMVLWRLTVRCLSLSM
jgi:glucose repression regulatory protein TUP1